MGAVHRVPLGTMEVQGADGAGPAWLDAGWHYRRAVVIHSEVEMLHYQVLITLTDANFTSFGLIKTDGSDIRLTKSDGVTELNYWIEPMNSVNHVAYVWVRLEPLTIGDTTLYLYYNNPDATSTSNGAMTFDLFDDDWTQFPPAHLNTEDDNQGITSNNNVFNLSWYVDGTPVVTPTGILNLVDGEGILSKSAFDPNIALSFRANFRLGTGHMSGGFIFGEDGSMTVIDDLPTDTNLYLTNSDDISVISTKFEPSDNWHEAFHVYEIQWKNGQSIGAIDHGISSIISTSYVPYEHLPVTLSSYSESGGTLLVDWVYVRQYYDPEPSATVGTEQGLVDLSISVSDSVDPVQKDKALTYLLTISNNSSINAPGVVVTDTLPTSKVIFVSAVPPGCVYTAPKVICSLNTIAANASTSVSIVVNTFDGGVITNTAVVDSLSYELELSNNTGTENTLVDEDPPNVNWVYPVPSGQKYLAHGSVIELEVSAADNDQVVWVDFWYWDHLAQPPALVQIGKVYTYPYQIPFNSNALIANSEYQVFAQASDRAGNVTDIRTPPSPVIYVTRSSVSYFYLPLTIK